MVLQRQDTDLSLAGTYRGRCARGSEVDNTLLAQVCHRPQGGASSGGAAPEVVLSILDGSELAQYMDQDGNDANVVYFVARAAFSRPLVNFTAQDVTVGNGELCLQQALA